MRFVVSSNPRVGLSLIIVSAGLFFKHSYKGIFHFKSGKNFRTQKPATYVFHCTLKLHLRITKQDSR